MAMPLVVVRAGGFGRESLDVVDAASTASGTPIFDELSVADSAASDASLDHLNSPAIPFLENDWPRLDVRAEYLVGICAPSARWKIDERFAAHGSQLTFSEGVIVSAGVQVPTNFSLGQLAHLNSDSQSGHDFQLNNFFSVEPTAVISTDITMGAGCVVLPALTARDDVIVVAAAGVTRDIERSLTVKGVPAR